jgi:hypothetical protein
VRYCIVKSVKYRFAKVRSRIVTSGIVRCGKVRS